MRVALAHDWLTGMRGGEKVLQQHAQLYPDAPLYTLIHVPNSTDPEIESHPIHTSPLSQLPGAAHHYRKLLPLFPWAVSRLRPREVDLVLSSSHAVVKAIRPPPGALHLCYCFTPMRYVWDQADAYLGTGLRRVLSWPLAASLREWDRRTSGIDRVSRFIAISGPVSERIQRHYGRSATVIHPPVAVERFSPRSGPPDDFYLMVGGFVPYKREDLAIAAFRETGRPLWIAGDGPTRASLERQAPDNVRFLGRVDDPTLADLYARCRALIYPQEEDFGIVPVEAQAAGRPVIALGAGGATETVVPLDTGGATETVVPVAAAGRSPTGLWFGAQSVAALVDAVRRFEQNQDAFDPAALRRHAEGFSNERFRREMRAAVAETLASGPVP
jgi:glycosyltransferase involved in cell wall biosynthesis